MLAALPRRAAGLLPLSGAAARRSLRRGAGATRARAAAAAAAMSSDKAALEVVCVPCLQDNYAWLLREPRSGAVGVVDPSEAAPVADALAAWGGRLDQVLITHHHWDHVGGVEELKARYGATVVGPAADAARIPGLDVALADGEAHAFGALSLTCLDVPGHTRGHVALHFPAAGALFPGDTLFSLGCGRVFEGTPAQMWASLSRLAALPPDTRVYAAHEYTLANAKFALSVDPGNAALRRRADEAAAQRAAGRPTLPSRLGDEVDANPMLLGWLRRPGAPAIRVALGVPDGAGDAEAFAAVRAAKDAFRSGGAGGALYLLRIGGALAARWLSWRVRRALGWGGGAAAAVAAPAPS